MKTYSPAQIAEKKIETYPLTGGWAKILGNPDVRFSSLIRGKAKSGKSTYCAKFAQEMSQFGRVLYVSAEERTNSTTLQLRIKNCGVTSEKVRFTDVRTIEQIDRLIQTGGYHFVIIDSVQHINMTAQDWLELKFKYKRRKLSWHLVMQMGVAIDKYKHEVDVLVELNDGWAMVHGRNAAADRMRVINNKNAGTLFD